MAAKNHKYWVKKLLAAVPFGIEFAWTMKDIFSPQKQSYHPCKQLVEWTRLIQGCENAWESLEGKNMMVYCGEIDNSSVNVPISAFLASRGCSVCFVYSPFINLGRNDSTIEKKRMKFRYLKNLRNNLHPRIKFINLMELEPSDVSSEVHQTVKERSIADTKYLEKREEIDVERDARHRSTFEFRYKRNLDAASRMLTLLSRFNFDRILIMNGNLMELGVGYSMARLMRRKVTCFEFVERLDSIVISHDRPITDMDTSREWKDDEPHRLSVETRCRIESLISTRNTTQWHGFQCTVQKSKYQGLKTELLKLLKVETDSRRIALVCPNVPWDSAISNRNPVFNSLVDWVRETVRFFRSKSECLVLIRIHPAETIMGTGQPIRGIIKEICPDIPAHIKIFDPSDPINTYELMGICDLGIVYNSTVGLEMALRGIPTIVAGSPHYGRRGFTIDISTKDEYFKEIDERLKSSSASRISDRQIELAYCYADVYFHKWPKPYPWLSVPFEDAFKKWPITRVLSKEGHDRFKPTFDYLLE